MSSSSAPLIGMSVGSSSDWLPDGSAYRSYADAMERAGGRCTPLGPRTDMDLGRCRGLLVPGGWDIHPDRYDRRPSDEHLRADELIRKYDMTCDEPRDATELPLIRQALDMDLPILAICRGIQSLNVVLARKLIPDIATCVPDSLPHRSPPGPGESLSHAVAIESGSIIERAYGSRQIVVNTRHHQGMTRAEVAPELTVTAVAPDGIVEAVEMPDRSFVVGVQWHPERAADAFIHDMSGPLFEAFVTACGGV